MESERGSRRAGARDIFGGLREGFLLSPMSDLPLEAPSIARILHGREIAVGVRSERLTRSVFGQNG